MVGLFLTAFWLSFLPQFPCLSPDEGSFTLTYNGGKIMTQPVTVSLLWFGDGWQESGREALLNAITSLSTARYPSDKLAVPTLGNWWEIIKQYRDSSNTSVTDSVNVGAECFYTGPTRNMTRDQVIGIARSVFNKTSIDGFGGNLSCTQVFEVDDNMIYHVLFSASVMFSNADEQRELINKCSGDFAEVEAFKRVMVKMVWARSPQNSIDQCSWIFNGNSYLGPPNRDEKIDSLIGYTLVKIAEEVTNRDGKGWSISDGSELEVGSVCTSLLERGVDTAPLFRDAERNVSFNVVGLNGYRYMVQHIWDQQIRNCALKPSESCETEAVVLTQPGGYLSAGIAVNHTAGLQPYPPNQKCRWKIQYPNAKVITFSLSYLSITADADDHLMICKSDSVTKYCSEVQATNPNLNKNFKLVDSRAYVEFTSGDHVSTESRGWELSYSVGLCNGKEDVYDHDGVIGYTPPLGYSYVQGLSCQWILHGKPGTPVSLSFTHINTSKDLDFLAIYHRKGQEMATQVSNFSGLFSGSNLPQINLTGDVMIAFATQTDKGTGWSANFHISSPINRNKPALLIVIIVSAVVLLGFFLAFITLMLLRKRIKIRSQNTNENFKLIIVAVNREEECIGEGPSAIVYRGSLTDGSLVAVKYQRERISQTDLEEEILLRASSHPNIISLLGYTQNGTGRRHLVFEFMSRGTLSWNLRERGEILSWEKRLAIALQVSSALQLLHMYSDPPIYHGNLRSQNVLLDESWNAKLGGFGNANYYRSSVLNSDKPSMEEDIWNFGLLLVELLRGEALVNRYSSNYPEYLNEMSEFLGSQEFLDPRLEIPQDECKLRGLAKLSEIAKWCISNRQRIGGVGTCPMISEVGLGLKQVKQLFCSFPS